MSFLPVTPSSYGTAGCRCSPVRAIRCKPSRRFTHVPLWSLTQVNKGVAEKRAAGAGERVVVPRHLMPLTEPRASARQALVPRIRSS